MGLVFIQWVIITVLITVIVFLLFIIQFLKLSFDILIEQYKKTCIEIIESYQKIEKT